jgi:hypothetical protein
VPSNPFNSSSSVKTGNPLNSPRGTSVQIDLTYIDTEDRMLLKIVAAKVDVSWLLTRKFWTSLMVILYILILHISARTLLRIYAHVESPK